ncbi:chorismate mutase [Rhodococcus ruber]|nr:chorismate mutase [Rhodococcus ruber]MCD2129394.1 chorismate mutase [Rhodococcus ruber]MCZ4505863.1 chorismate mutase [Rhodococcus ruber]MCZ4533025.1 chorismate mutase [Rhodococcus ruber]MCZ4623445.1 chorismate mutase [Rhodococcus ruber]MDI9970755.1 chorismate mutase [Rhodococcus ruber]
MTVQLDSPGFESAREVVSTQEDLGRLFDEIGELDAQILEAIERRSELSRRAGIAAKEFGTARQAQNLEMRVLDRFAELGADGKTLAMTLLRLGRTRLS